MDVRFGPRGALYVCDWYNPVKGHSQYALRDSRRDRKAGRIWRITAKDRELLDPPKIDGESIPALLEILKRPEHRYRYWAKRELRDRDHAEVVAALDRWLQELDDSDKQYRHHQTEAMWMYRGVDAVQVDLMKELLECEHRHARSAATRMLRHWHSHVDHPARLLEARANDESSLVRMEAVQTASWIGTAEAMHAALDVLDHERDGHLDYALACSLGSKALRRHWEGKPGTDLYKTVNAFLAKFGREQKFEEAVVGAGEAQFDAQTGLKEVTVSTVPERMLFTVTRIEVKTGQPVKLVFTNPDATEHNLVIVEPGAAAEVGIAATEMAKDPESAKLGFVPPSKRNKILHHTRLVGQNQMDVLRFRAPEKPGTYPYICTFPGHWVIMRGTLVVTK